jgi:hypothetical protein
MKSTILINAVFGAALLFATTTASAQAPFASGMKLQQGGATDPSFGLTLKSKQTFTANPTLSWTQPTGNGIMKITGFGAGAGDITFGAVGLSTADVTGVLPVANGGTGVASLTGNGVLSVNAAGDGFVSTALTNGQLLIGSTGAAPVAATLTAGTGVTITNAAGSITISTNLGNISNNKRIALSAAAVTYSAQTPPAGFTLTASSVILITVLEAGGFPITATVSSISTVGNTFDFVISGYPTAASEALLTFQN